MTTTLETSYEEVYAAIKNSLSLDSDYKLTENAGLFRDLSADNLDLGDILYNLGVNISDYCSGGRLNNDGKRMLALVVRKDLERPGLAKKIEQRQYPMAIEDINVFFTPKILRHITEYDRHRKLAIEQRHTAFKQARILSQ